MGDWSMIRLIAARELRERSRTRGFLAATAFLLVVAVAAGVVPAFLDHDRRALRVGIVGAPSAAVASSLPIAASGEAVDVVEAGSVVDADDALRQGKLDVVVEGTTSVRIRGERTGERATDLAERLASAIPIAAALESAGVPPEGIGTVLSPTPLPVRPVEPPREDEGSRDAVLLGGLALYIALFSYAGWVGTGVVEEKSSRVVEVVLSAVRPAELLAGKVLGIGVLGLAQLVMVGGAGLAAAVAAGTDVPSSAPGAVGLVLLWFVLGFAFYSSAFAVAGSAASRQEDAQAVMGPLYVLLIVSYFVAQAAQANPEGTLARVSAFVPPLAPLTAPSRVLLGHAPVWETAASVAVTVAGTVVLVRLAARVYGGAVLRFGPKLGFRELVSGRT